MSCRVLQKTGHLQRFPFRKESSSFPKIPVSARRTRAESRWGNAPTQRSENARARSYSSCEYVSESRKTSALDELEKRSALIGDQGDERTRTRKLSTDEKTLSTQHLHHPIYERWTSLAEAIGRSFGVIDRSKVGRLRAVTL